MSKSQANPTDVFMQFAAIGGVWPGVTTVLTEVALKTGLSIRGGLMWLLHQIEFATSQPAANASIMSMALSVRDGLVTMPTIEDPGCLAELTMMRLVTTTGATTWAFPHVQHFLPPIPLAAPNLSLYFRTTTDDSGLDTNRASVRLGYTTTPLDAKAYAEIAETWAYV